MKFLVYVFLLAFSLSNSATVSLAQFATHCGCEDKPLPEVLATVNGQNITQQDLGTDTKTQISILQGKVIEARDLELERQINTVLLETEARKRGVTVVKFLQMEVTAKVPEPTEAEARAFYDQRRERMPQEFKHVKNEVIRFLKYERERDQSLRLLHSLRAVAEVKVFTDRITAPANEKDKTRVVATVNGVNITSRDIEDALLPFIFTVQEQVYAFRKNDLDLKINDLLLQQEAKRQGVTPAALLDKTVRAKVPIVTEEQAQNFFKENKEKMRGDFGKFKNQIFEYLLSQEERKLNVAFAEELRRRGRVQLFFSPPESPSFKIAIDDQPTRGNPDASVTVVQFTDYECPVCAKQYPAFEKLIAEYSDQVKFVVRDYPLAQHENAVRAAHAAEAAREQGKYWEYVAMLYANQTALQTNKLKQYAAAVGLDEVKFEASLDSERPGERVQRDLADGGKLGINSSPVFFVNGRRVSDYSYEALKAAILTALKRRG